MMENRPADHCGYVLSGMSSTAQTIVSTLRAPLNKVFAENLGDEADFTQLLDGVLDLVAKAAAVIIASKPVTLSTSTSSAGKTPKLTKSGSPRKPNACAEFIGMISKFLKQPELGDFPVTFIPVYKDTSACAKTYPTIADFLPPSGTKTTVRALYTALAAIPNPLSAFSQHALVRGGMSAADQTSFAQTFGHLSAA